MVRIAGINVPDSKNVWIGLTYIFGIGRTRSKQICEGANVPLLKKMKDLSPEEVEKVRTLVGEFTVEGDLRREIAFNIKRLIDCNCYRGQRHKKGLPLRGQRTKTNAKTRKRRRA